jgi:hypothetical protein
MNIMELQQLTIDYYKLGANYCRTLYANGGVCIYLQKNLTFVNTDLAKYCKDKHFEVCDVILKLGSKRFCIITIYCAPTGDTDIFLTKLDIITQK